HLLTLPAVLCRRDFLRPYEIDSRSIVSLHRQFQHRPAEDIRKSSVRESESSDNDRTTGSAGTRQGHVHRWQGGHTAVTKPGRTGFPSEKHLATPYRCGQAFLSCLGVTDERDCLAPCPGYSKRHHHR